MRAILLAVATSLLLPGAAAAQTEPAPPPAPAPAPAPQAVAQPPRPFPQEAKVAFINVQRIANETEQGRVSSDRVQALNEQKVNELAAKNTQIQAAQQKLQQSGSVLSDAARSQLEREIERIQVDIQRFTQDAQTEVRDLQEELQNDFQRRLLPVIQKVSSEKALHMVFSQQDAGLVWADPGLDITEDVISEFDEANPATPATSSGTAAAPPQL